MKGLNFAILAHFNTYENSIAYVKQLGVCNRYTTFPNLSLIRQAVLTQNMATILSGYAIQHGLTSDLDQLKRIALKGTRYENEIIMCLIHRSDSSIRFQEKVLIHCIKDYFSQLELPNSQECK